MIHITLPMKPRETLEKEYLAAAAEYEGILNQFVQEIRKELKNRGINVTIRHRVKSFSSWYAKLLKCAAAGGNPAEVSLTDVLGIRIICPFLEEVSVVCDLLNEIYPVTEVDVKGADYPYQYFGYESVHFFIDIPAKLFEGTSFPPEVHPSSLCEIQVRTILQEAWAEVEHELVYKSDFSPLDEPLKRKLAALNANLTLSDIMFQEIREYQKSLHTELRKRRKEFYHTIHQNQEEGDEKAADPAKGPLKASSLETVDSLLLKGLLAHNDKKYDQAIEVYSKILKRTGRRDICTVIYLHRGMAYFTAGQEEKALADFNSALDLDPENGKARYYRAVYARIKGQFVDAFSDLSLCLEKEPYNLEYITARGETHFAAGNREAAREDYLTALHIDPDFKPARRLLEDMGEETAGLE